MQGIPGQRPELTEGARGRWACPQKQQMGRGVSLSSLCLRLWYLRPCGVVCGLMRLGLVVHGVRAPASVLGRHPPLQPATHTHAQLRAAAGISPIPRSALAVVVRHDQPEAGGVRTRSTRPATATAAPSRDARASGGRGLSSRRAWKSERIGKHRGEKEREEARPRTHRGGGGGSALGSALGGGENSAEKKKRSKKPVLKSLSCKRPAPAGFHGNTHSTSRQPLPETA